MIQKYKIEKRREDRVKIHRQKVEKICIKQKNAITLIAFVITIIILLVLAGVVIYFVINVGILDKARTCSREIFK